MSLRLYGKGDPPVPCYTCGKMSDHWFPDGSPAWSPHSHDGPTPYYRDEAVTLYLGDYREFMPLLAGADLLVMDPPFDEWSAVQRVDAKTVITFTTWQHRDAVHALYGRPRAELIWAFSDGRWVSHNLPRITHETILVFGGTSSAYVGSLTDGLAVRKGRGSIGRDDTGPRTYTPHERKSLDSVLRFPRDVGSALGVWSKPLGLMTQLVQWCAPEMTVADPFAGSGTTLVVAKALGLKAVGVEIDERHAEIAANRCRQEVLGL